MTTATAERLPGPKRFWIKVDRTPTCWVWQGYKNQKGYGRFGVGGKRVHRIVYELFVGSIPEGMTLDHLCRNRACVNPDHLEVVTAGENTLRGDTLSAANQAKVVCIWGHPFTKENTQYLRRTLTGRVYRACRVCRREVNRRHRAKRR